MAPPTDFGKYVSPIPVKGSDYAHHITKQPILTSVSHMYSATWCSGLMEAEGPEGPCSLIPDVSGIEKRTGAEAERDNQLLLLSSTPQIAGTSTT